MNSAGVEPREMRVIWLLLISAFVAILNETTMGTAIPAVNASFGTGPAESQWLTSAFMLTMAIVIPATGILLERFTTRQMFLSASGLFAAGTLVCLCAPSFGVLVTGRVVQASGTAIMMPLLMTTLMQVVPPHHRGQMMGRVGLVISLAPALGPVISGAVTESLGWRWTFAIVLPIALAAMAAGAALLSNVGESRSVPIDPASVVMSALGFGGIVFGLSTFSSHGQTSDDSPTLLAVSMVVGGVVSLALFIWRQIALMRTDGALLDLRVFSSRNFAISVAVMTVLSLAMFGTFSLVPLYLQTVVGLNPLSSGLVLLPGSILMGLLGPVIGRIYDHVGPRPLIVPGTMLTSASLWFYATIGSDTPMIVFVGVQMLMSVGFAMSFTPLFSASLGSLPPPRYSHGSAVLNTLQQVGGAAGVALLLSRFATIMADDEASGWSVHDAGDHAAHTAFLIAASISILPVIAACFIHTPADQETSADQGAPAVSRTATGQE